MKLMAALAFLLPLLQDDKVELKWKFEKGQELRYKITQTTAMDAGAMSMEQVMSTTYSHSVTGVDEKGATLVVKYESLSMKTSGLQQHEYDSEKDKEPPADPGAQMMAKLVGQSFTVRMAPSGRVLDVKGFDKILENMAKGLDGDDPQAQMTRQMMKQMFSDDTIRSMLQQMYPPLPEGRVGKGDTWKNQFNIQVPMLGKVGLTVNSKLAGFQGKDALIDQDMKMEIQKAAEGDEKNPLQGFIELKDMKGKSTGVFSLERGVFVSAKGESSVVMSAAGQEMELKSKNEVKLLEGKPGKKDY